MYTPYNRVFELEQDSVVKDVRIPELETSNTDKDSKIQECQANMGGLTALYLVLQQTLIKSFGDDFKSGDDSGEIRNGDNQDAHIDSAHSLHPASNIDTSAQLEKYVAALPKTNEQMKRIKRKMLIRKNSNHGKLVMEIQKDFSEKYGDCWVISWGYDTNK